MWRKLPKAKWLKSQSKAVVQRGEDRLCTCGCQALKTLDTALREQAETNGAQPKQSNSAKLFSDCIETLSNMHTCKVGVGSLTSVNIELVPIQQECTVD